MDQIDPLESNGLHSTKPGQIVKWSNGVLLPKLRGRKTSESNHRQSKKWTGNAGKIANVADAAFVMRPDTLCFGTLYLYFKYISRLFIYKF